jgi:hypothetical protein
MPAGRCQLLCTMMPAHTCCCSYWESVLHQAGHERASDKGATREEERTRGCHVTAWQHENCNYLLFDHGGMSPLPSLLSQGLLTSPHSVFVVVLSLAVPRAQQRCELRAWLQVLQSSMYSATSTALLVVGSRADRLGALGTDYLDKLWDGVQADLR